MLTEKAENTIAQYNMISAGETVCAALSGGADSTALLLVLKELSGKLNFTLTAVHVNHLLRGEESDRDEAFCRDLCGKLEIPLTVFREDAAAFSHSMGASVETGARELRYKLFETLPADKIAAAHNQGDNAETVIFRLARGTGLRGLTGIPPVRDLQVQNLQVQNLQVQDLLSHSASCKKIIRPLLFCSREEIEEYLRCKGQNFVTDSTNLSDDYSRNRIRHKIIPEMIALHGGFPGNITALTASLAEDEDFLTGEAMRRKDEDLRLLHPALRKRVIINLLKSHKLKTSAAKISEICEALQNEGKISLDSGSYAVCEKGRVKILPPKTEPPEPQLISKEGKYSFYGDKIVIITKETDENVNADSIVNKKLTSERADYDKIQGGIVLRNRLRSDKIKPAGQPHTKELRKLLQEKLPREKREISAVVADDNGVVWAEHAGFADRVVPDKNTRSFLKIEIYERKDTGKNDG